MHDLVILMLVALSKLGFQAYSAISQEIQESPYLHVMCLQSHSNNNYLEIKYETIIFNDYIKYSFHILIYGDEQATLVPFKE